MVVLGFIKLGSVGYLGLYRTSASEIYSSYHNLSPLEVLLLDLTPEPCRRFVSVQENM